MFKKLASLVGARDRLVSLARARDWRAFARALAEADVHIFTALGGEGLDIETMTSDDILRETERAAMAVSETTGFMPLTYQDNERRYLPFFSNQKAAEMFAGAYISKVGRFFPMQMLDVKGAVILQYRDAVDCFVLNDQSDESFDLPVSELAREE